jgi:hypothetical protein
MIRSNLWERFTPAPFHLCLGRSNLHAVIRSFKLLVLRGFSVIRHISSLHKEKEPGREQRWSAGYYQAAWNARSIRRRKTPGVRIQIRN